MKLLEWLKQLVLSGEFSSAVSRRPLPRCLVRPLRASDVDVCIDIYRRNEGVHLPYGVLEDYCEWIKTAKDLVLVVEADNVVVGSGGICRSDDGTDVYLSFGIVDPRYHQKGFGTVLLMSRLWALPEPDFQWKLCITSAGQSCRFYRRFGFVRVFTHEFKPGLHVDCYNANLSRREWRRIKQEFPPSGVALQMGDLVVSTRRIIS